MERKECRFCSIRNGKYAHTFDEPILQTENFFSIVSVGDFVGGWSLVVPKEHVYSMRTYYSREDFWEFTNECISHIKSIYGDRVIIFEHGANSCESTTSCGTNHAHLHVVPFSKSIIDKMQEDREWIKAKSNEIETIVADKEYLLYADPEKYAEESIFFVHILEEAESQYFRRLLADCLGIEDYSYKSSPYYQKTADSFAALKKV